MISTAHIYFLYTTDINCRSYYSLRNFVNIVSQYLSGFNLGTWTHWRWYIYNETLRNIFSTICMYLILRIWLVQQRIY